MQSLLRAALVVGAFSSFAAAQPTVTPNELTFNATVGAGNPASQTIRVETATPGQVFSAQVRASLTNPSSFLTLFPTNGQTPSDIAVSVDSSGFVNGGVVTADIDVTITDTGQSTSVRVLINVFPASTQPLAGATPAEFSFAAADASAVLPPQELSISNIGGGVLDYDLQVVYPSGPEGWLTVDPTRATINVNPRVHQLRASPEGLEDGTHAAQIILTGNGANTPLFVPVTLTIGGSPPQPSNIQASPASLFFAGPDTAEPPPPQLLEIRNTGGGTVSYDLRVSAGAEQWLFVTPAAGSVAGAPFIHTVSIDTSSLTPGSYTANLILSSESLATDVLIPVSLRIQDPGILFTQPATLDFVAIQGMPLREKRTVSILNSPSGVGRWSAFVTSLNSDWVKVSPEQGELPGKIIVEIDTTSIAQDTVEATIGIAARRGFGPAPLTEEGAQAEQAVITVNLPVRLTLLSDGPRLSATPTALRLRGSPAGRPESQLLLVDNVGGPQLNWNGAVETDSGGQWLSLSPRSGTAPTDTVVTANPAGQQPGAYHGRVVLSAGDQSFTVPVVMVVEGEDAGVEPDFSGVYWEAAEGRPSLTPAAIEAVAGGASQTSWSASATGFTGADSWVSVAPGAGVSSSSASSGFELSARTQGLPPGFYGSLISLEAVGGGPRKWVSALLEVKPPSAALPLTPNPSGILFDSLGGSPSSPRQVTIRRNREGQAGYLAGASTFDGAEWLTVSPAEGETTSTGSANLEVSADPAGLEPGVYRGFVSVSFGDGAVDSVFVTLAVRPTTVCTANGIFVAPLSPHMGFVGRVGRAVQLEAAILDSCGELVDDAAVLALFNNGDSATPLRFLGGGRYTATWAPLGTQAQANVILQAQVGSFRDRVHVIGFIDGGAATVISPFGVVNGASFRGGEAISPGEIISVFGRDLTAGQQFQADAIPLSTVLGDTSLRVGPVDAPLYFAGATQLNVQAPFELSAGSTTQLIARLGAQYSVPVEIAVASARPGVFTLLPTDPDRAIVQNQDFSINSPENPAARGEAIVAYVSGAGAVEPSVATGEGSPSAEPLARAVGAATVTVGGEEAEVLYLGMTPGFVGLAQVNLFVPESAPVGPGVQLILTIDGQPSNPLAVAIEAAP